MTAGVSLYKTVSPDLKLKIVSNKYVELSSLIDPKQGEIVFTLKSQATDQGFLPVWSPLQPKGKPLSILQRSQAFLKYASVFAESHPENIQQLFTYIFKILDLASCKGDWQFYDREFRKDREQGDYSFSGHRVDLYTKALSKGSGEGDIDFRTNYSHNLNIQPFQVPKGFCYAYHSKASRCNSNQCRYDHKCFRCDTGKVHPAFECYQPGGHSVRKSQSESKLNKGARSGYKISIPNQASK